jgi:hypothetical protein
VKRALQMTQALARREGVGGEILVGAREKTERFFVGVAFPGELAEDFVGASARTGARQRQRQQLAKPCIGGKFPESVGQRVIGEQRRAALEQMLARRAVRRRSAGDVRGCQMSYFGLALRSSAI